MRNVYVEYITVTQKEYFFPKLVKIYYLNQCNSPLLVIQGVEKRRIIFLKLKLAKEKPGQKFHVDLFSRIEE